MDRIRMGTKIRDLRTGTVYTVKCHVRTYEKTTPRFNNDPNPHPAGTVVLDLDTGGLDRRPYRPGSFEIVATSKR